MENFKAHGLVSRYIRENKLNKNALARTLRMSKEGLKGQTETCNMRVDVLIELSAILKYNFFADISEHFPKEYDKGQTDEKDEMIKTLELEIMILKREKDTLKSIILAKTQPQ